MISSLKILEINNDIFNKEDKEDYVNNLEELGISGNIILNWKNIITKIQTVKDLDKITTITLGEYIANINKIQEKDKEYIVNNFKTLLGTYLKVFPNYKSDLLEEGLVTGIKLKEMPKEINYYMNVVKIAKNMQDRFGYSKNILSNIDIGRGEYKDAFKLYIKDFKGEGIEKFLGEILDNASDKNKKAIIDWAKKDSFFAPLEEHLKNKEIVANLYKEAEVFGFDTSIGIEDIVSFYNDIQKTQHKIKNIEKNVSDRIKEEKKVYNESSRSQKAISDYTDMRRMGRGSMTKEDIIIHDGEQKKKECMQAMDKKYVTIMLKKKPRPNGIIQSPFTDVSLDFSKKGVDQIIRDGFMEQLSDQWDIFLKNIYNDKQAAFGQAVGMIAGIGGATLAGLISKNLWVTSVGFTTGLRIGNGLAQEAWNFGEYIGGMHESGNNKVDKFGDSFMRGAGLAEYKYDKEGKVIGQEFVGWGKLATDLGFDYISNTATFGIGNKFSPFLNKLGGLKLKGINIGNGLKFGFEELFMESFLVDIPMNVVRSGVDGFVFGEGEIITGQTALGNKQSTVVKKNIEKGNLEDALNMMIISGKSNLSFENLSQVFFNTITYGGLLEGGGAAIRKIKARHAQYATFATETDVGITALDNAQKDLQNFLSKNNIKYDKNQNIFTQNGQKILNKELQNNITQHVQKVQEAQANQAKNIQNFIKEYKQKISDKTSVLGSLFTFGLISNYKSPELILNKRLKNLESKINKETNLDKKQELERLREEYLKIQERLNFDTRYNFFDTLSEDQILDYARRNYDYIIEKYKKKMGNIVNVDDFRDYVGGDVGIDANKTHKASSYLADRYFEELLKQNKGMGNNTIKFLAGGPGSGKSSIDDLSPNNKYPVILDGTLKTYKNAIDNINKALELGYKIRIEFVYRDINEAFINGVIKRTVNQNISKESDVGIFGLGRTVPIGVHEKGHMGSRNTILKLYEKFGGDVVKFFGGEEVKKDIGNDVLNIIPTSKGSPPYVAEYSIDFIRRKIEKNQINRELIENQIEKAFLLGKITLKQKKDLLGLDN